MLSVQKHFSLLEGCTFALIIGLLYTLHNYAFGIGDHLEQLPIVLRFIDNNYLINDFFTNVSTSFGPRYYFANIIATLSRVSSLPAVYFLLTILSNCAIAIITFLFARDLFNKSSFAGIFAVLVVMTVNSFRLGYVSRIHLNYLVPASLATPFVLLSIMVGFREKPIASSFIAGFAAIIHPLLGLETGAIVLLTLLISKFNPKYIKRVY